MIWEAHVDDTRRWLDWDWWSSTKIPTPKALSGTNNWLNNQGVDYYQRFFTHDGALYFDRTKFVNDTNRLGSTPWEIASSGWKHKTRLVNVADDAGYDSMHGYMYALAPKEGRIYRYEVTKGRGAKQPTVDHAGRQGGFTALKSLALAGRGGSNTILLGTTRGGKLRMITIPDSSTFAPSIATVDDSGWKYLDYLATDNKVRRTQPAHRGQPRHGPGQAVRHLAHVRADERVLPGPPPQPVAVPAHRSHDQGGELPEPGLVGRQ